MTSITGELLNAVYTTSAEGEQVLKRLTRSGGFTADNIVSRLAIARSLREPVKQWDESFEADSDGKQIKGFTLLGRHEIAVSLLAMMSQIHGPLTSPGDLRRLVRLHWERGLRLIDHDLKDGDFENLLIAYAQQATLTETSSQSKAARSPKSVFNGRVIGQISLKQAISRLLDEAIQSDPVRLAQVVVLMGPSGWGRRFIAQSMAEAIQLPFAAIDQSLFADPDSLLLELQGQLAAQGYVATQLTAHKLEIPSAIIYVATELPFNASLKDRVVALRPRATFTAVGDRRIRLAGGAVVVGSDCVWNGRWIENVPLASYTRDEVAEILRTSIGGWPLEIRRYLALAGRLSPALAMQRATQFREIIKQKSPSGRPSESMLLEAMGDWGIDRLGLVPSDYETLGSLHRGEQPDVAFEDRSLLERLGLIQQKSGSVRLTGRGREAYSLWETTHDET